MATLKNTTIDDTGFFRVASGINSDRPGGNLVANGMIRFNSTSNRVESFANGTWQGSGYPFRHYYEGIDANLFTANWNNATTTYMTQFGGFGPMYAHGYSPSTAYTLTLTNLPAHNTIRYKVNWHFVDSVDGETNFIVLMNSSGAETTFAQFRKTWNVRPVTIDSLTSGATMVENFQSVPYSYKPWPTTTPSIDGYLTFDSGYYSHSLSSFTARHQIGLDQAITDEACYFSHVEVWLGA